MCGVHVYGAQHHVLWCMCACARRLDKEAEDRERQLAAEFMRKCRCLCPPPHAPHRLSVLPFRRITQCVCICCVRDPCRTEDERAAAAARAREQAKAEHMTAIEEQKRIRDEMYRRQVLCAATVY